MSHMSDVGFELKNRDDFKLIAKHAIEKGQLLLTSEGSYWMWNIGNIELWPWFSKKKEGGLNPHFNGLSLKKIKLTNKVLGPGMDGKYHALMIAEPGSGIEYPLI